MRWFARAVITSTVFTSAVRNNTVFNNTAIKAAVNRAPWSTTS
ncbi:hypothetical protein [Streptomyces asoensis]